MRKAVSGTVIAALLLGFFLFYGCQEESGQTNIRRTEGIESFAGVWECEENPLNDPNHYTGYLKLEVSLQGEFSVYDAETGDPGLSGSLVILSDSRLQLLCSREGGFNPPPTWDSMQAEQELSYKFTTKSAGKLRLTYRDEQTGESSTLIFNKVKE